MLINKLLAFFILSITSLSPQKSHFKIIQEQTEISAYPKAGTERRVAIDWGSSSIRALLADVSPDGVEELMTLSFSLALGEDLQASTSAGDGLIFSEMTMQVALDAFANLKATLAPYNPKAYRGIATAAFRKAANGEAFLSRLQDTLGVTLSLVPQKEEAELGFLTAASSFSGDIKDLVVCDIGNGSFQLVAKTEELFDDYGAEIGCLEATTTLIHEVQHKGSDGTTPNPVTLDEARALADVLQSKMPPTPSWLKARVSDRKTYVATIGSRSSPFSTYEIVSGHGISTCNRKTLWEAIEKLTNTSDTRISEEFPDIANPHKALAKLVLLYAMMEKTGIDHIDAFYTLAGSTQGIAHHPSLWKS